jgi:hypothetical protein
VFVSLLPTLSSAQNSLAVIVFKYLVFQMVEGQPNATTSNANNNNGTAVPSTVGQPTIVDGTVIPAVVTGSGASAPTPTPTSVVHDFLVQNLLRSLSTNGQLPVHIMVEPLVKHHSLHGPGTRDFDFFTALSRHRRLPLRHALLLMHLLGKIALNHASMSSHALPIFIGLVERYRQRRPMKEYVMKYLQVSLSLFMRATAAATISK